MEEPGWRSAVQVNRERIDKLDEAIAALLKERLQLAQEIGAAKAESNLPVKDTAREQEVLDHVCDVVADPLLSEAITRVYRQLLEESRRIQISSPPPQQLKNGYFPRVLVVGCGLIGGALARRIKVVHPETIVVGCDKPDVTAEALAAGVIDSEIQDPADGIEKASLVILAASPRQNMELLRKLAPLSKRRQVILDVTSTKGPICKLAAELKLKADFVGGHPLFGSQKSGFENSSQVSVVGRTFVLVPTSKTTELSLKRLSKWLTHLGIHVQVRDAKVHDDTVSDTSHLIQLLSIAVGSLLANGTTPSQLSEKLALSGPALATIARLMASPYSLWAEILEQNVDAVASSLKALEARLALLRTAIVTGQMDVVEAQFTTAKKVSETIGS